MNLQKDCFSNRNKTTASIALILILTFSALLAGTQFVNADTTYQTACFMTVSPNPAAVNQLLFVSFWIQPYSPGIGALVYHGLTVTITDPTGVTVTKGPFAANPNAGGYFSITPTILGKYSLKFSYPGESFPTVNRTYLASATPIVELIVQQNPITYQNGPGTPLPTSYWTRPISAEMREWTAISGNWLMEGYDNSGHVREGADGFNPYTTAPKSAHIMWTQPNGGMGSPGGLVGGELGDKAYYGGLPYYSPVYPPIILQGRLYYNLYQSSSGGRGPYPGLVCLDLRTGQELWRNDTAYVDVASTWYTPGIDESGSYAFLWATTGSTWTAYDPMTGKVMFTFANATTAARGLYAYGSDGTMYAYVTYSARIGQGPTLLMWNSTKAFYGSGMATLKAETAPDGTSVSVISGFLPAPGTYDWQKGIQWNITEPILPGGMTAAVTPAWGIQFPKGTNGVLVAKVGGSMDIDQVHVGYDWLTGAQLWVANRSIPGVGSRGLFGSGIYAIADTVSMTWIAYDIKTGQQLWVSDPAKFPWGAYTSYSGTVAYGLVYTCSYDGYVHVYNLTNGKTAWDFYTGNDPYGDTPYGGQYPVFGGPLVAGDVVFVANGEHTPNMPLYRGEKFFAIDAHTGKGLWNISGWLAPKAIADGYLVAFNAYDNQIYTFGKGPSKTTVSAPQAGVTKGSPVMITGTVTDQTPKLKDTPAISDTDMSAWMEYMYMQRQIPGNAKGVPVTLTAIDPNGNSVTIGTVDSDIAGNFGIAWSPNLEGTYQIKASFAGSNSYGSSFSTAYLVVGQASAAPTSPPTIQPTATPTVVPTATASASLSPVPNTGSGLGTEVYIAIAAAVVIAIVAAAALVLRKRK
jgi:outer membrane protein assembly factor BamB